MGRRDTRTYARALLLLAPLWATGAGCGDEGGEGPEPIDREGLQLCCDLGARCHVGPDDPVGGEKQMCHTLGHQNDPEACRAQFESCLAVCGGEGEVPHACL